MKTRFQNSTGTSSGNNRLSFMRNAGTTAIVKETNYYPFGLTHQGYNNLTSSLGSAGAKKYQYNGKELQEDYGLDWYDYGARFYDAGLGRWFVADPLAEKATSWTPYRYAFDNPIHFIDPNGMSEDWYENENKKMVYNKDVKSQEDLDAAGIKGTYKGEVGVGVEGEGNNQKLVMYKADGQKHDASYGLDEVEIDGGKMSEHAKLMSNPVYQSVHKGQNDFLKGTALLAADILGNVGTGVTLVGYGAAFVPGGQIIAEGFIGTGKAMTTTAGILQLGINIQEKNLGQAMVNGGLMIGSELLGAKINSLNYGKQSTLILKTGKDLKFDLGNRVVNTVIDRRKNQ